MLLLVHMLLLFYIPSRIIRGILNISAYFSSMLLELSVNEWNVKCTKNVSRLFQRVMLLNEFKVEIMFLRGLRYFYVLNLRLWYIVAYFYTLCIYLFISEKTQIVRRGVHKYIHDKFSIIEHTRMAIFGDPHTLHPRRKNTLGSSGVICYNRHMSMTDV